LYRLPAEAATQAGPWPHWGSSNAGKGNVGHVRNQSEFVLVLFFQAE
jgi:hypothetical protein